MMGESESSVSTDLQPGHLRDRVAASRKRNRSADYAPALSVRLALLAGYRQTSDNLRSLMLAALAVDVAIAFGLIGLWQVRFLPVTQSVAILSGAIISGLF